MLEESPKGTIGKVENKRENHKRRLNLKSMLQFEKNNAKRIFQQNREAILLRKFSLKNTK
jgi:hypothetical protein